MGMSSAQLDFMNKLQPKSIQERFEAWLDANPDFWPLFVQYAREVKEQHAHYGARAIVERVRWHTAIHTHGEPFKINDHFAPRLARKLKEEYPEFQGFFEFRRLHRA